MFGGSSLSRLGNNPDGSYNIYCSVCGEFISTTLIRMTRALCILCQNAENGVQMTPEALAAYKASKLTFSSVSAIALPEPDIKALGIAKKSRFISVAGEMLKAVGSFALNDSTQAPKAPPPSAVLAKSKRPQRLFSGVKLGSIEEVDNNLKKEQSK